MERMAAVAGNLRAKLYEAQFEYKRGRMSQDNYLQTVRTIRGMAAAVRNQEQAILNARRPGMRV
jgi:hypothetical protein